MKIYFIERGWPEKQDVHTDVCMFHGFHDQLSFHNNIIYKGEKVIVPAFLQMDYVQQLFYRWTMFDSYIEVTVEKMLPRREPMIFPTGQL